MKKINIRLAFFVLILVLSSHAVLSQTTQFTYQGSLQNGGAAANGNYDFEFAMYDALFAAGNQVGATVALNNVVVTNGIFTVKLDFGAQFTGEARFLEIRVKNAPGPFTVLAPRQTLTSTPYAVRSLNSTTADTATNATTANNALNLGGVPANQYVVTTDPGMTDARNPLPGSANYIQNQNAGAQSSSNFNVSGTGTANIISATTQYNIGANRVLSNAGSFNLFAGVLAGNANTTGGDNAFFGSNAGQFNTTGGGNAFFGRTAGFSNTTGGSNAFFGNSAGSSNTTGSDNAFFGTSAGASNTASGNSFFGRAAGSLNTTGFGNAFFGMSAGESNTTGSDNAFFGMSAGESNTTGAGNAFFGTFAGDSNTASGNSFFGRSAGAANTTGFSNAFFGNSAGNSNTTGDSNAFFGRSAGESATTGNNNTIIGSFADVSSGAFTFATAIGSGAVATESNSVWLGRAADIVYVPGFIRVQQLGVAGATAVCRNANDTISTCSSSLRYKTNIGQFSQGMSFVNQLRPITYDWKDGGLKDVGFGAEDVAKIDPRFVTYNTKGEVEGVKYDRLSVAFVNAFKEQQTQIEAQEKKIETQQNEIVERKSTEGKLQSQIDDLKKIVCSLKPDADGCKQEEK